MAQRSRAAALRGTLPTGAVLVVGRLYPHGMLSTTWTWTARGQIEADAREEAFMAAKIAELDGRLATLNAKAAAILDGLGSQLPPADEPEVVQ